jgi:metal-responsive CopG/Arc/MetJ family transcriptional regulator
MLPDMDKNLKERRVPVMVSADWIAQIDAWRIRQPGIPTRSEAIRRIVSERIEQEAEERARRETAA